MLSPRINRYTVMGMENPSDTVLVGGFSPVLENRMQHTDISVFDTLALRRTVADTFFVNYRCPIWRAKEYLIPQATLERPDRTTVRLVPGISEQWQIRLLRTMRMSPLQL